MSAVASASLPTIQELLKAVQSDALPHSTIQNLFVSALDQSSEAVIERIKDARRVYDIVQKGTPPHAVFYKLDDPKKKAGETTDAFYKVFAKTAKRDTTYEALIDQIDYFKEEGNPDEQLVAEKMSNALSTYMANNPITATITKQEIERLFDNEFKAKIVNAAIDSFFRFSDRSKAGANGGLYDPSSNQTHNWGVNSVWTAALVARKTPIKILSPLLESSGTHSANSQFTAGSSAFALEIAIAIKVGYTISFSSKGEVELLPPVQPKLDIPLPARDEQIQIYAWCYSKQMEAKQFFAGSANPSASSLSDTALTFSYTSIDLGSQLKALEEQSRQASASYGGGFERTLTHAYEPEQAPSLAPIQQTLAQQRDSTNKEDTGTKPKASNS